MVSFYDSNDLYDAVWHRNVSKARRCLKAKVSPDYCPILSPAEIMSLVSIAIVRNDEEMVRLLLKSGADVHGKPERAFVEAAHQAREKAQSQSLRGTSNPDRKTSVTIDYSWETPLHIAVAQRMPKMVQILFDEADADPNILNSSEIPPLFFAIYYRDHKTAQLIVERCATLRLPCASLETAMQYAADTGQDMLLADLIMYGGPAQALALGEQSLLYKAAHCGHFQTMAALITEGADIDAFSSTGMTAFFEAASNYEEDGMKMLLDMGAEIDAKDNNGCTALHRAAMAGHKLLVRFLLDNGANPRLRDDDGWTCLYASMVGQNESITKLLIDVCGIASLVPASASATHRVNQTALHLAASTGSVSLMRHLLLGYGATRRETIDALNEAKETPLCLAAANGHRAVARILLSHGADANYSAQDGRGPLYRAAERGDLAIVRDLLRYGARITPGCIPAHLGTSLNEGHIMVTKFLHSVSPDVELSTPTSGVSREMNKLGSDTGRESVSLTEDQKRMLQKQGKPIPDGMASNVKGPAYETSKKETSQTLDPFEASIPEQRPVIINHHNTPAKTTSKSSENVAIVVSGALQMIGSLVSAVL